MVGEVLDDVGMWFQLFEDGDLAHSSGRYSLILIFKFDFLDGDEFFGSAIFGAVDHAIGALSDGLKTLEVIHPT